MVAAAPTPEISAKITGLGKFGTDVTLTDLEAMLRALQQSVTRLARARSLGKFDLRVAELSRSSAAVAIEPISRTNSTTAPTSISQAFFDCVQALENKTAEAAKIEPEVIDAFADFATLVESKTCSVTLAGIELTQRFVEAVHLETQGDSPSLGSAKGMLDAITIHGKNQCLLYPVIHAGYIRCQFDETLKQEVIDSLGHCVTVFGRVYRRSGRLNPVRIEAVRLVRHPKSESLPKMDSLRGAWSKLGLPDSEEIVRKLRDEE